MELESQGYFAVPVPDHRSALGERLDLPVRRGRLRKLSVQRENPFSRWYGVSELDPYINTSLEGQDLVSVGDAFGESFLYYSAVNPFHQEAGTQGDFRQEGRGLWSADPGRLRLLSSG